MRLTPHECRAGRALLDWSQAELAKAAGVTECTIAEFECERRRNLKPEKQIAILQAFHRVGVHLVAPCGVMIIRRGGKSFMPKLIIEGAQL